MIRLHTLVYYYLDNLYILDYSAISGHVEIEVRQKEAELASAKGSFEKDKVRASGGSVEDLPMICECSGL